MIAFFHKWLCRAVFGVYCFITTTLLLFTIFEVFPGALDLINLQGIRYYALKTDYLPDSSLIFVPRRTSYKLTTASNGNLYSSEYGVSVTAIQNVRSYTEMGFRVNSSSPPYQVIVIGDSFLEIGDDAGTLSERLQAESGLSTFNLGRGWYGPYQYLELFRKYGIALKPKYALFCFFGGNDIHDIKEYERWRREGVYYFYRGELSKSFLARYLIALSDTGSYVLKLAKDFSREFHALKNRSTKFNGSEIHPGLGMIRIGRMEHKMKVTGWDLEGSPEQLLASKEWQTLRSLLTTFRQLCRENGIEPVLVYIPSKIEVYADYATADSGQEFKRKLEKHYPYRNNASEAITILSKELNLSLINLLPYFKRLTEQGELLYYPFDSHWNFYGTNAAAKFIAMALR
jgi:SGNH hydrolase-like domain, acetyltransferase AlgX